MTVSDLQPSEFLPYFKSYIDQAKGIELLPGLDSEFNKAYQFFNSIPEDKLDFRYAEGKWSIKEIINHLIDTERIFCYRALRFARQDKTALSGFNENDFVDFSNAKDRTIDSLLDEYKAVRQATITMFKSFTNQSLMYKGIAGAGEVSVRALGFLIIGHEKHHIDVIKQRYL
ncbi:DinB family protein [Olleya sp. YS]|uniref:DinB family protein n=1 Tax=Olleya sp. YS TaxID=3028318 RepID=UPI00243461E4|nr:DinB family protein [Olleya sp. YS]WGD34598.1 DinB family protein [Olleya sp. YS]